MTLEGVVLRSLAMLALVVLPAVYIWWQMSNAAVVGNDSRLELLYAIGAGSVIAAMVAALVTVLKPDWSPVTAPAYAIAEGIAIGGVSMLIETKLPGIVMQAVALTFATFFSLLVAYGSGWIRATDNLRLMVFSATGAIALLYLVSFALRLFGGIEVPFIHENGWVGIGFSLFVVAVAALNLVLDFDHIERAIESGAPKHLEWYAAFGLTVTLVWLYLEILRLLAKIRSR
jgi:uncharacterized YccA/Bax inhibitor family protein